MNKNFLTAVLLVLGVGLVTVLLNCKYHWFNRKSVYALEYSMTIGDPGGGDSIITTVVKPYESNNASKDYKPAVAIATNPGDTTPPAATNSGDTPTTSTPVSSDNTGSSASDKGKVPPPCALLGMCEVSPSATGTVPNGVAVTMTVDEAKPGILLMTFNIKQLQSKQPSKADYFSDKYKTCQFGSIEMLTDSMFVPLHLLPNARISHKTQINIIREGEKITLEIHYEHD